MNSMKFEKFDSLFHFLPKSKIKAGKGLNKGKYRFFRSGNNQSKFIDSALFEGESLIVGDGGNANINYYNEKFSASDHCFVIQKKNDQIDVKYVYYYLKLNIQVLENGFKGIGLKNISKKYISNIKIPILEIEEQRKVARHLTQIERLIEKRETTINLLNQLIDNTFLDMFENDLFNNKFTKFTKLNQVCHIITDGTHQSPNFKNEGIPFLFVSNIVNNKIIYKTKSFVSKEDYEKLAKRTPVEIGSLLLTTVGSYGNPAIIETTKPFTFQRHIAFLKPNHELINYKYLFSMIKSEFGKRQIDKKVKGIAQKTLNLSALREMLVFIPEREKQDKFAKIYSKIENTKIIYQNNLNYLNELLLSVSQKAFKNELDLGNFKYIPHSIESNINIINPSVKTIEKSIKKTSLLDNFLNIGLTIGGVSIAAHTVRKLFDNYNKEIKNTKVKNTNKIAYNEDVSLEYNKIFLKHLIKTSKVITNTELIIAIKKIEFEKKPSYKDIKESLIDLLENEEVIQFNYKTETIEGFDYNIAFKVKE